MAEQIKYFREAASLPTLDAQREAMRAAGLVGFDVATDRAYLDVQPKRRAAVLVLAERAHAIQACRVGNEFWIAFPLVLAPTVDDALLALEEITRQGAVLRIASTGATYRWQAGAAEALALAREIGEEARKARTTKASAAARKRQDRTRQQQKAAWDKAAAMWRDLANTVAAITAATGIPARTLYNAVERGELPPRGAQPFTGGPKAKRRGT